jgi:hypothetical protein
MSANTNGPSCPGEGILLGQYGGARSPSVYGWLSTDGGVTYFRDSMQGAVEQAKMPWSIDGMSLAEWSQALQGAGFFNIPDPPQHGTGRYYLGLGIGKRMPRTLVWGIGDRQTLPGSIIVCEWQIRSWLCAQFAGQFGL